MEDEMEKIKVFETTINSDMTEGRGLMKHLAFFKNEEDAELAGKPHKVMGVGVGHEVVQRELIIFDSYSEYLSQEDIKLYEGIMRKLSKEEKRVLGLG
jgi:hypothetical protein